MHDLWAIQRLFPNPCVVYPRDQSLVVAPNLSHKGVLYPWNLRLEHYAWSDVLAQRCSADQASFAEIGPHFLSPHWCARLTARLVGRAGWEQELVVEAIEHLSIKPGWYPLSKAVVHRPWKQWRQRLMAHDGPDGLYRLAHDTQHARLRLQEQIGEGILDAIDTLHTGRDMFLAVDGTTRALVSGVVSSQGRLQHSPRFWLCVQQKRGP